MSKKLITKVSTAVVSIATVVSLSGAGALLPMTAYGATVAELQAQINALLAQIQTLQAQLSGPSTSSSGSVPASLLSSGNLTLGSKGAAVMDLQKFLNANGAQVAASGAGSVGNETSTFGSLTKAALAKWQAANGVSPAAGYFGSVTRAKLASMSGGVSTPSTPSTPSAPVPATTTVIESVVMPIITTTKTLALPNSFDSTLRIEGTYQSRTISTYGEKILNEFRLTADEKIGITRIKFTNTGTFHDAYLADIRLINSRTDKIVAAAREIGFNGKIVTFNK